MPVLVIYLEYLSCAWVELFNIDYKLLANGLLFK